MDDLRLKEHGSEIIKPGAKGSSLDSFPDRTYLGGLEINDPLDQAHQIHERLVNDAQSFFQWESLWEETTAIPYPYFLT